MAFESAPGGSFPEQSLSIQRSGDKTQRKPRPPTMYPHSFLCPGTLIGDCIPDSAILPFSRQILGVRDRNQKMGNQNMGVHDRMIGLMKAGASGPLAKDQAAGTAHDCGRPAAQ
jgi:hypothetical protein